MKRKKVSEREEVIIVYMYMYVYKRLLPELNGHCIGLNLYHHTLNEILQAHVHVKIMLCTHFVNVHV